MPATTPRKRTKKDRSGKVHIQKNALEASVNNDSAELEEDDELEEQEEVSRAAELNADR